MRKTLKGSITSPFATGFLFLDFFLAKKYISVNKYNAELYITVDIKEQYSIEPDKYKDEIKQLVKTLIEHQLVSLSSSP